MQFAVSPPSALWQWVAIVASFIALVLGLVALPTVVQMIWGHPQIVLGFDVRELLDGRILQCNIWNSPILNRWLRRLCVRRMTAEDIVAHFTIKEVGTDRIVYPGIVPELITYAGSSAQRVSLPGLLFPLTLELRELRMPTRMCARETKIRVLSFHQASIVHVLKLP